MAMQFAAGDGKATFDHIYDELDPRAYYRTLGALDYEIPQQAYPTFDRLLSGLDSSPVTVLDLCCSYGINAALMRCALSIDDLFARYADSSLDGLSSAELIASDRNFYAERLRPQPVRVLGLDLASNAIGYAREVKLLDDGWAEDLETNDPSPELAAAVGEVDLITITGGVGYITARTFDRLLSVPGTRPKPLVAASAPVLLRADRGCAGRARAYHRAGARTHICSATLRQPAGAGRRPANVGDTRHRHRRQRSRGPLPRRLLPLRP